MASVASTAVVLNQIKPSCLHFLLSRGLSKSWVLGWTSFLNQAYYRPDVPDVFFFNVYKEACIKLSCFFTLILTYYNCLVQQSNHNIGLKMLGIFPHNFFKEFPRRHATLALAEKAQIVLIYPSCLFFKNVLLIALKPLHLQLTTVY